MRSHVGVGAITAGVAALDRVLQRLDRRGDLDGVAGVAHGGQRIVQRLEHREVSRRPRRARVGREVE